MSDYYHRCAIERFSYRLTGQLDVKAEWWGTDEGFSGWGGALETGVIHYTYSYGFYNESEFHLWSEQTSFAITPAPVPKPAMPAMLAAGLLSLLLHGRRRQRRQGKPGRESA